MTLPKSSELLRCDSSLRTGLVVKGSREQDHAWLAVREAGCASTAWRGSAIWPPVAVEQGKCVQLKHLPQIDLG